jgi:aerobic-type carbon monoxide dehydrogenase small subunit (CoxS/CutS family)
MPFNLNGKEKIFDGDPDIKLLDYLRTVEGMSSPRDGCDSTKRCGVYTVGLDEKQFLLVRFP